MLLSLNLYLYIHITNTEPSYVVYMEQYKQVAAQKSLTLIHWDKMADLRAAQEQEKFALVLLKWREPIITSGRMRRELDVAWRIEAYGMNLGDWNMYTLRRWNCTQKQTRSTGTFLWNELQFHQTNATV